MDTSILKACFHNALYVEARPSGLIPCRYTPAQISFYDALPYGAIMGEKARCSSGVTLEFDTDAPEAVLHWQIVDGYKPGTAERGSTLDVYINGVLRLQHPIDCPWHTPQKTLLSLGTGANRVVIYLPHTFAFSLRDICLPQGFALAPLAPRARRVLLIGDSITQGIGADFSSCGYAMQLARALDCEGVNQSVAAVRFEPECLEALDFAPDLIAVALGTNDWACRADKADYDRYAAPFFARLNDLYRSVPTLVISPIKRCRDEGETPADRPHTHRESQLFEIIRGFCAPYPQMQCVDGWQLVPHTKGFFRDGLHPNDLGMTWFFSALLPHARSMLKQQA